MSGGLKKGRGPGRVACAGLAGVMLAGGLATSVNAAGVAENALLIIDPTHRESLLIGHTYGALRGIPASNYIYMAPGAADYDEFVAVNAGVVRSTLDVNDIGDHIDFVIIPPADYRIPLGPYVTDQCSPVAHISMSGMYTTTFVTDEILGGVQSLWTNEYYTLTTNAEAFDGSATWLNGGQSSSPGSRRYLIGAMLGYRGSNGNSFQEVMDLIDRSVAADGTRPSGTFYLMETTDEIRSGPRDGLFPTVVAAIEAAGGMAEHQMDVLPEGSHDILGVMTGWAEPDIDGADMTITPGAFCDHLTSFAGFFGTGGQTKMSRWIAKGASASAGTVEEPCNFPQKFPAATVHVFSHAGLSLGESYFRSLGAVPFQSLFLGDPLCRPFTYIPDVSVPDAPGAPVSGTILLSPSATTAHPTATVDTFSLLINGVLHSTISIGESFEVDTALLGDGYHDLRVLAEDNTPIRATGRWLGSMDVDNTGRSLACGVDNATGNLNSAFQFTLNGVGGPYASLRLMQGTRVVAAATGDDAVLTVYGWQLGGGPVEVIAEAVLPSRVVVRSSPITLDISNTESPEGGPVVPVAYGYTKHGHRDNAFLVELPASYNTDFDLATWSIVTPPAQSTVVYGPVDGYVVLQPDASITGTDSLTFEVTTPGGTSNQATVDLIYGGAPANDLCAGAPLIFDGDYLFDTIDADNTGPSESGDCASLGGDIWYRYIAQCEGAVTIEICDVDFDAAVTVYVGGCPASPDTAVVCATDGCPDGVRVTFPNPGPALYQIRIAGVGSSEGYGLLSINCGLDCVEDCAPAGGDGFVDILDLLAVLAAWGTADPACDIAGADGPDGTVDIQDLLALLGSWGPC